MIEQKDWSATEFSQGKILGPFFRVLVLQETGGNTVSSSIDESPAKCQPSAIANTIDSISEETFFASRRLENTKQPVQVYRQSREVNNEGQRVCKGSRQL